MSSATLMRKASFGSSAFSRCKFGDGAISMWCLPSLKMDASGKNKGLSWDDWTPGD